MTARRTMTPRESLILGLVLLGQYDDTDGHIGIDGERTVYAGPEETENADRIPDKYRELLLDAGWFYDPVLERWGWQRIA